MNGWERKGGHGWASADWHEAEGMGGGRPTEHCLGLRRRRRWGCWSSGGGSGGPNGWLTRTWPPGEARGTPRAPQEGGPEGAQDSLPSSPRLPRLPGTPIGDQHMRKGRMGRLEREEGNAGAAGQHAREVGGPFVSTWCIQTTQLRQETWQQAGAVKSPEPGGALWRRPCVAMEQENDGFVSAGELRVLEPARLLWRGPPGLPARQLAPPGGPGYKMQALRRIQVRCRRVPLPAPPSPPPPTGTASPRQLMCFHNPFAPVTQLRPIPSLPVPPQPTSSSSSRGRPSSHCRPPTSRRAGRCVSRCCWWPATRK